MPMMSRVERRFCSSGAWRRLVRTTVAPWVLQGRDLQGEVLEVGGGSGALAEVVARGFPRASVSVTDIDPAMVRSMEARLSGLTNTTTAVADATSLPYGAAQFDVVLSNLMLHHVIAWRDAVAEFSRVLKPGGLLLGYDLLPTPLATGIHLADRSPFLLVGRAELMAALLRSDLTRCVVDRAVGGVAMRFSATRAVPRA